MDELIERLRERAEFEDKRVLDEAKAMGFEPEVYTGSQTGVVLREAAAALEAAREDGARLDWLDTQNLPVKMGWKCQTAPAGNVTITSVVFLGVAPTTIRQAIDQARGKAGGEGVES